MLTYFGEKSKTVCTHPLSEVLGIFERNTTRDEQFEPYRRSRDQNLVRICVVATFEK